jgi:hypothetical protein
MGFTPHQMAPETRPYRFVVMSSFLEYEIKPGSNVAQGLPRQRLTVLSPIWRGRALTLRYPDGEIHTLVGWSGSDPGAPCDLQVFWTRTEPTDPAVALAIGGDAGVRHFGPGAEDHAQGAPFLGLADSMIPAVVRKVIGPPPPPEPKPRLLLA